MRAVDLLGAVLRATLRRPYADFSFQALNALAGEAGDAFIERLLLSLGTVLQAGHTPVCKASAVNCMLLLAACLPNLHRASAACPPSASPRSPSSRPSAAC